MPESAPLPSPSPSRTVDRPMELHPPAARLWAVRAAFRAMGSVAPGLAARWAEALFCRPPRPRPRPAEEVFLRSGTRFSVDGPSGELAAWSWGAGPTVLLSHGWGSRAGRFVTLAPALVEAGFRAVAFDAPAHGASDGTRASMPEFAAALQAVNQAAGPAYALVGHSLGGASAVLALSLGLVAERVVLIATPADVVVFSHRFAQYLGIPPHVRDTMQRNLEERLRVRWTDLHIPTLARAQSAPALVIHDADDPDIPATEGRAIAGAWPGAEFVLTSGLGHRVILRDPGVAAQVAAFVAGESAA